MDEYINQTQQVMKRFGIRIAKRSMGLHINRLWDESNYRNKYLITVTRGDQHIRFMFWDSIINTQKGDRPTDYDILTILKTESYCPETFEDFCNENHYQQDKKKEQMFKKLQKQSKKILSMFTSEELEQFPD